ncbi:hypothetical protein C5167_016468 [Papaver somniferum]|nr:hypothetical protein C5167_016468 [Papaver somniferum]
MWDLLTSVSVFITLLGADFTRMEYFSKVEEFAETLGLISNIHHKNQVRVADTYFPRSAWLTTAITKIVYCNMAVYGRRNRQIQFKCSEDRIILQVYLINMARNPDFVMEKATIMALVALGLKSGGTLQQRAERLFLINVSQANPGVQEKLVHLKKAKDKLEK